MYIHIYVHVLFYALAGLFRKKLVKCRPGCPPPVTYSLSQCLLSSSMRSHSVLAPPTFISSVMQHGMYLTEGRTYSTAKVPEYACKVLSAAIVVGPVLVL